ncbi:hypothetical protein [Brevibacillus daliensis]|uniref:hypothetical protein n=1 Tax=Brevibacillus daliensis TaxID=2892995 RepID=UPI001E5D0A72|nr:hypothetical protein [Brevibacillus daliensis]
MLYFIIGIVALFGIAYFLTGFKSLQARDKFGSENPYGDAAYNASVQNLYHDSNRHF